MKVLDELVRVHSDVTNQNLEMILNARLAGIQIIPNDKVERPTLLVSPETYKSFVEKFAPEREREG